MGFTDEFKAFVMRGNVIDLAVGIVIGGAFGKIVSSLVADMIMPAIGLLLGGVDFTHFKIILKPGSVDAAGKAVPEVAIRYGLFINTIIDFILIALAVFLVIKLINRLYTSPKAAPPPPPRQEQLLEEIRDLLKAK